MTALIRVLIADDHEIVREGLEAILSSQPDIQLVGVARNGVEAVMRATECKPDVILMDLVMPEMDGLEAIQVIRRRRLPPNILVLTSFADDERVFPAIKAGALGYLLKDAPKEDLLRSIHAVARGEVALHPSIARRMVREINRAGNPAEGLDSLTGREMETLKWLARGLTNQEIAETLCVHENTVAKYVSAVLRKLHLDNRTQAALFALRSGIASLQE
jgi:NarL family two-component system response regulator LiaR